MCQVGALIRVRWIWCALLASYACDSNLAVLASWNYKIVLHDCSARIEIVHTSHGSVTRIKCALMYATTMVIRCNEYCMNYLQTFFLYSIERKNECKRFRDCGNEINNLQLKCENFHLISSSRIAQKIQRNIQLFRKNFMVLVSSWSLNNQIGKESNTVSILQSTNLGQYSNLNSIVLY